MYRHILVTLDSKGYSEQSLAQLQPIVRKNGSSVQLLCVYPPMRAVVVGQDTVVFGHQLEAQANTEALAYLARVAARLQERGIAVTTEVRFGDPVEMILATVATSATDLIVMPVPWCRGDGRLMTAEVTTQVIRQAPVPVLVVRLEARQSPTGGRSWTSRQ